MVTQFVETNTSRMYYWMGEFVRYSNRNNGYVARWKSYHAFRHKTPPLRRLCSSLKKSSVAPSLERRHEFLHTTLAREMSWVSLQDRAKAGVSMGKGCEDTPTGLEGKDVAY